MPRLTPKQYNQILAKSNPAIKAQLQASGETGQYDYARDLRIIIERHAPDLMRGVIFEYRFWEKRNWSMDAVWFPEKVFIEVNGGRWKAGGGRHGGGADYQKLRKAAQLGYYYVPIEPDDLSERLYRETIITIREILGR